MIDPFVILAPVLLLAVVALLRFVGCAAILGLDDVTYTAAAQISVTVTTSDPTTVSVLDTVHFSATVTNDSADPQKKGVTWSVIGASNVAGTISSTGEYRAPSSISGAQPVTVIASSVADSSKSGTATVNLVPVTVNVVSPPDPCVGAAGTKQFTAQVTGPQNKAVDWDLMVAAVGGGDNIKPSGLYTAPTFVTQAQTVTVRAASKADPTKSGTAKVYLYPFPPCRPLGSALNQNSLLFDKLVGLFIMNESGTTDQNLVPNSPSPANFRGVSLPSRNLLDPSIVFNGGGPANSFLDTGPGQAGDAFDQLPTSKITIVAKVNADASVAAGVCEKNDGNAPAPNGFSGFIFGWDNNGALLLTVERANTNMRVATASGSVPNGQWVQVAFTWDGTVGTAGAADAHLFVKGLEQTKAVAQDGLGAIGTNPQGATTNPFRIGTTSFDVPGSLNGRMAYLAIYKNRLLTPAELITLDAQLPITAPP